MSVWKDSWNVKGKQGSGKKVGEGRKRKGKEKERGEQGKENRAEAEGPLHGPHQSKSGFQTAQSGIPGQKARVKRLLGSVESPPQQVTATICISTLSLNVYNLEDHLPSSGLPTSPRGLCECRLQTVGAVYLIMGRLPLSASLCPSREH